VPYALDEPDYCLLGAAAGSEELASHARAYGDWLASRFRQEVVNGRIDLLLAGVLFLFAAVVAVPLAARLGIGAVLGYLLAGSPLALGLGFISDVDEILHFSELGVVFLMFIIGLELNPSKLWRCDAPSLAWRRAGDAQRGDPGGLLMLTGFHGRRRWSAGLAWRCRPPRWRCS
jgi:hypothetical protein